MEDLRRWVFQHAQREELPRKLIPERVCWNHHQNAIATRGDENREHSFGLARSRRHDNRRDAFAHCPMSVDGMNCANLRLTQSNHASALILLDISEAVLPAF